MIWKKRGVLLALLALVLAGGVALSEPVSAKTVSDPNHKGFTGKHPRTKQVYWKPIKAKCEQCTQMAEQYNQTMQQLLNSRYWVHFWRQVHKNRDAGKADPFWPGEGDITEFESRAVGANLELLELQQAQLTLYRQRVALLEQQASYLRGAIIECETTACGKAKKPKIKDITIGGDVPKQPFQPDYKAILTQHGVNWAGPYSTNCPPCAPIVARLNAVPGWITRAHFKLQNAEQLLAYSKLVAKSNKIKLEFLKYTHPDKADYSKLAKTVATLKQELAALKRLFDQYLAELAKCEQKYCAVKKSEKVSLADDAPLISVGAPTVCNSPAATEPISVGPNSEVGSSANFKEKAKKKVAGAAVGAVTKLLGIGGGGGGGGKSAGPPTYKDPIKKKHKTRVRDKAAKRDFYAGGGFTEDGLLISSDIKKAPGKGTFHTIYLENARGWRLMPIGLLMYEIWRDWKLSVSWTRDTYVDGELVKHEEGGWTESWRELIARGEEKIFGEVSTAPIWEQLGFTTAVSGARSLGAMFPVSPQMLVSEPWNLVVHVSDPKKDPVTTVPYIFELGLDGKGNVTTELVDNTVASQQVDCEAESKRVKGLEAPSIGELFGGASNQPEPFQNPLADRDLDRETAVKKRYGSDHEHVAPHKQRMASVRYLVIPRYDRLIELENMVTDYAARADLDAKKATLVELQKLEQQLLNNGLAPDSDAVREVSGTATEFARQIEISENELARRQYAFDSEMNAVSMEEEIPATYTTADGEDKINPTYTADRYREYKAERAKRSIQDSDDTAVHSVIDYGTGTVGSHELSNLDARKVLDEHRKLVSQGVVGGIQDRPGLTRLDKQRAIYGPEYKHTAPFEQGAPEVAPEAQFFVTNSHFERLIRLENGIDNFASRADLDARKATLSELHTLKQELLDSGLSIDSDPVREVSDTAIELAGQIEFSERELANRKLAFENEMNAISKKEEEEFEALHSPRVNEIVIAPTSVLSPDGNGINPSSTSDRYKRYKADKAKHKAQVTDAPAVHSVIDYGTGTVGSHELSNLDARKVLDKNKKWAGDAGQRFHSVLKEIGSSPKVIGSSTKTLTRADSVATLPSVSATCPGLEEWQLGTYSEGGVSGLLLKSLNLRGNAIPTSCAFKSTLKLNNKLIVTDYFSAGDFIASALDEALIYLELATKTTGAAIARAVFAAESDAAGDAKQDAFPDRDGDGIQDSIDTKPDEFSDEFFQESGSMVGKITNRNGNTIRIIDYEGGGVGVEVGSETENNSVIELLGVELEVSPGTIMDANFG